MSEDFGDRMKVYESAETSRRLMPLLPIMARIDGRCFSKFTKDLDRPFDFRLTNLMIATTEFIVRETVATCGYTQSDEISLGWLQSNFDDDVFFAGKVHKVVSGLASLATAFFIRNLPAAIPELADQLPTFDCRVWNVPNVDEGANVFLWREKDATKNSISMAARCYYEHKELHGKTGSEMQEMLWQKDINWNDYPSFFKRGTFVQRRTVHHKFTAEELKALPEKHKARKNPDMTYERTAYVHLEMPPFGTVTNRPGVIFFGEEPVTSCAATPDR